MPKVSHYLCIDFGLSKMGIAIGQSLTCTAHPLTILKAKSGVPNWHEIQNIINEWAINTIVVGVPVNMDGSEQRITKKTRKFISLLSQQIDIPIIEADERISSVEARSRAEEMKIEQGLKINLAKDPIDHIAAAIILESWMQNQ